MHDLHNTPESPEHEYHRDGQQIPSRANRATEPATKRPRFYVTIRERRRFFETLADAVGFANRYAQRTGNILGIERTA